MTELLTPPSQPITARSFPQQFARSGVLVSQVWNRNGKRKNKVHLSIGFMRRNASASCYTGGLEEVLNQSNWVDSRSCYASKLKLCRSIEEGQTLHGHIIRTGFGSDVNLINKILGMYVRCRRPEDARQLFDEMSERNAVTWTTMVGGYTRQGHGRKALDLFCEMQMSGVEPNNFTFATVLGVCAGVGTLQCGEQIHGCIIKTRFELDGFVENALVDMYAKCQRIENARKVFDKISQRNAVSWTAMIVGYAQLGHGVEALSLFNQMQREQMKPDDYIFTSVLSVCGDMLALGHGQQVHAIVIKSGFESNVFVGSALVGMYVKCDSMEDARQKFEEMPERNVVSWTAMINGYDGQGQHSEALLLFKQLHRAGLKSNQFTFAGVLRACAALKSVGQGRLIHACVIRSGFESNVFVGNALLDMYAKCGSMADAEFFFDEMTERNTVSWTVMIQGYAINQRGKEAFNILERMHLSGLRLDQFTFSVLLSICADLSALEQGKQVHACIVRSGFESNVILWNTVLDMYAKCGRLQDARVIFNRIPYWDLVSWNAMIAGYDKHGYGKEGLQLFEQLQEVGMKPNQVTFASVLSICASLALLEQGKQIHASVMKKGLYTDVVLGNALIDMYAKCGHVGDARHMFNQMPNQDAVSWTAMIAGYGKHGDCKKALKLYEEMLQTGMKPDHVTLIGVLSACSHGGLVDAGRRYFSSMSRDHGIIPSAEHYACMVDLLGRAGHLVEAKEFISHMPFEPTASVWGALLSACRVHFDMELGKQAAEHLLELQPQNAGTYILLSNIYAAAGMWDDTAKVRSLMENRGIKKVAGCSWIQIGNKVHAFVAGDRLHPQSEAIYAVLEKLARQMKEAGYVPDTNFVLHDVEEEQKENILLHHSEKLAIAFGIINRPPGMPIRIVKNLRVCGDCHTAIKIISKIVAREIVMRDANRFHQFKDGLCTCGDYW